MRGAEQHGGRIISPIVKSDPLYLWIRNKEGKTPEIGSLPNHFVIETNESADVVARAATCSLKEAWRQVCDAIWRRFMKEIASDGHNTEEIWKRQTQNFWEVLWTAGTGPDDGSLLARRKHWRSYYPLEEPGDKCTVMHDLQELSGFVRARGRGQRKRQDEFWEQIRNDPCVGLLNLREDERLCAIAFVKRLFPLVTEALGWKVDATQWPSTVYLGAWPWMKQAYTTASQEAERYAKEVEEVAKEVPGTVLSRPPIGDIGSKADILARLDANWFHLNFVRDDRRCLLPTEDTENPERREHLVRLLKEVYEATDSSGRPLGKPSSFYALLKADGDRLGKLVREIGPKPVGKALARFTREVPEVVRQHDGVTVYAGGDDVLALLPVPRALLCAETLSDRYRSTFDGDTGAIPTLSAAVVFAHIRLPLRSVLSEAGRLLDDVAKDDNGRDSLAVGALKPGGMHCQWVTTWKRHRSERDSSAVQSLNRLVDKLSKNGDDPGFSSSLVYRIRETLSLLCGQHQWEPGIHADPPEDLDVRAFLRAEILRSLTLCSTDGTEGRTVEEQAVEWAELVEGILSRARADENTTSTTVGLDALLLAHFLADPDGKEAE